MEDAFGVQVAQAHGNLTAQLHPRSPAQVLAAVQQLLQVATIYVLKKTNQRTQFRSKQIRVPFASESFSKLCHPTFLAVKEYIL